MLDIHSPAGLGAAALSAVAAGFINALAGGGTLVTFPVLVLLGLPPVSANVTNTVALLPGYLSGACAQRRELRGQLGRMAVLVPVALFGGLGGALALASSGDRLFRGIVPWLIYLAVFLLAIQAPVRRRLAAREAAREAAGLASGRRDAGLATALAMGAAAVYAGYFGAGVSVIVIAVLALTVDENMGRLNALKQVISLAANLAAAVWFAVASPVDWPLAGVMALGAVGGGLLGGSLARRVKPGLLKAIVLAAGLVSATWFLLAR